MPPDALGPRRERGPVGEAKPAGRVRGRSCRTRRPARPGRPARPARRRARDGRSGPALPVRARAPSPGRLATADVCGPAVCTAPLLRPAGCPRRPSVRGRMPTGACPGRSPDHLPTPGGHSQVGSAPAGGGTGAPRGCGWTADHAATRCPGTIASGLSRAAARRRCSSGRHRGRWRGWSRRWDWLGRSVSRSAGPWAPACHRQAGPCDQAGGVKIRACQPNSRAPSTPSARSSV